ncbi:MAG: GNAT family N-acetyltransferase [Planctomycetota bacterium]
MDWRAKYAERETTPDDAVRRIPRGKHIQLSSGAAVPTALVAALGRNAAHFADNTIVHLMTFGPAYHVAPEFQEHFRHNAFFIGANVRSAVHEGRADYTPVFLSRIPALIRARRMPVEVVLVQCTPPDKFGYVNLGVSVDIMLAGLDTAALAIAEINPHVPTVHGAGYVPMERFDHWIYNDAPLVEHESPPPDEVSMEIGRNVSTLIENRSTLQLGIGAIPDATLLALGEKGDLGLWTEMFSDGVLELIERGVITGKHKTTHPGKVSASFTFGTRKLYDFIDRNPMFTFHPSDYINDPVRISQQHRMIAVNSALEVDLTGQVCADSIGTKFYSGIGGQVDFIRGASMCPGGKPIIALPSTAKSGEVSRITATLTEGAGVVTSRGDVRFVVTEYGIADLLGKSIRERAVALISIAHPDFRAELLAAAKGRHYVFEDQVEPRGRYPREVERAIETRAGRRVLLRPVKATDEPALVQFFYALSDNTIYKRFLRVMKGVSHAELQYFVDVDYQESLALILETQEPDQDPAVIGVAQYFLDRASGFAEVAFIVKDEWQGQGLGRILFEELLHQAQANGIRGFTANVLFENRVMMHLFQRSGLEISSSLEDGVYRLRMPFRAAEPA